MCMHINTTSTQPSENTVDKFYLLFLLLFPLFLFILTLCVCYYDDHFMFQLVRGVTLAVRDLLVHDNGL